MKIGGNHDDGNKNDVINKTFRYTRVIVFESVVFITKWQKVRTNVPLTFCKKLF